MTDFNVNNYLKVKGAREHNLKNIDVNIPLNKLVTVVGISGSGKSSLIHNIIANESIKHFNYHITSSRNKYNQRIESGEFDEIQMLPPGISIGQNSRSSSIYSTLGTLSDLSNYLRITFARFADDGIQRSKSLFSHFSPVGQCPNCKGLAKEEFISKEILLNDKRLSIAEGLIKTTLPNGYIMYSQLRMEELEKVCQAHGFSTTSPWEQLTQQQQEIIWNGSKEVTVTFGKHTLESRLKWKNLKAKPPEEGYYKGMIPVMEDILRRDRNPNILKYVDSRTCSTCDGTGLSEKSRTVTYRQKTFHYYLNLSLNELYKTFSKEQESIEFVNTIKQLIKLGFGDFTLNTPSKELESGEIQRIRLAKALNSQLSNVLYIFDEPFIGIHPSLRDYLLLQFRNLVNNGSSVFIIDHDLRILKHCDHIVELGPKAGKDGGNVVFNGTFEEFKRRQDTLSQLEHNQLVNKHSYQGELGDINLAGLKLRKGTFNVITGHNSLFKKNIINELKDLKEEVLFVDDSPIGKTSRSTPATYTGIADDIRNLYAGLEESKSLGLSKKHFSFNTKEGACSTCSGVGKEVIGFSYMGQIEKTCPSCEGKRYSKESLQIKHNKQNIHSTQQSTIKQIIISNHLNKKINNKLNILAALGLDYLSLNQGSNSLSGGEAQRIKLAKHLIKKKLKNKWLLLENPSNGLHAHNLKEVIIALEEFLPSIKGIICIDHHPILLDKAEVIQNIQDNTITDKFTYSDSELTFKPLENKKLIELKGVRTKNIQSKDYQFEKGQIHGFTGPSGSGKSALLKDTLYQIARNECIQHLSAYDKSFLDINSNYQLDSYSGIGPTLFIDNQSIDNSSNSTISTYLDINKKLRFLFARFSESNDKKLSASHFSKAHPKGQCKKCKGKTFNKITDSTKAFKESENLNNVHLKHNSFLSYYTNPKGQFTAVFKHICKTKGWNTDSPFKEFSKDQMSCYLNGSGDHIWELDWEFETKGKKGIQNLKMPWKGIRNYIEDDYEYSIGNKTIHKIEEYLIEMICSECDGSGLNSQARNVEIQGFNIHELEKLKIDQLSNWFDTKNTELQKLINPVKNFIAPTLKGLINLDLGYLSLNRLTHSLSGGELQRLKIADKISSPLTGMTYVIEEISSSLAKDKRKQIGNLLKNLKDKGNTIFIIDKDEHLLKVCDTVNKLESIDPSTSFEKDKNSTNNFIAEPEQGSSDTNEISFQSFNKHNIKLSKLSIPLGGLTAITGPSGIGKTTLLEGIYNLLNEGVSDFKDFKIKNEYSHYQYFKTSKPSQTKLSSYFEIEKEIVKTFAKYLNIKTKEVQKNKQNTCLACKGQGSIEYALDIEANLHEACITCDGTGYKTEVLEYKVDNLNISQWLKLSFSDLFTKLEGIGSKTPQKYVELKKWLTHFNLLHLHLDYNFKEIASGERFKFSWIKTLPELQDNTLIFIDEPSKNLYYSDMDELLQSINLINADILIIEHCEYLTDRSTFKVNLD